MKKTLSYFVLFAFLFSTVFSTGCFSSKNKVFSTRLLGGLGLAIIISATGGAGAAAFAANLRGAAYSVADNNLKVVGYAYSNKVKGDKLFEGKAEYKDDGTLSFLTTAEDEEKLNAHDYYLIEVEATKGSKTAVIMSAIYPRGEKKIDTREVAVNFETTAIKYAFEKAANADFVQFMYNAEGAASIDAFAATLDNNVNAWDGTAEYVVADADATNALTNVAANQYWRVYCDELPGTEKDGDFEYVDVSKYFLVEATDITDQGAPVYTFPIYSDATFDFYLKEASYTFKIIPKPGESFKDIFDQEVKKTKASNTIVIDGDKKLTEADFHSKNIDVD